MSTLSNLYATLDELIDDLPVSDSTKEEIVICTRRIIEEEKESAHNAGFDEGEDEAYSKLKEYTGELSDKISEAEDYMESLSDTCKAIKQIISEVLPDSYF